MARIQVVGIRPYSGESKAGNSYKMLIVKVLATDDDGVVEVGEINFFERRDRPLPALEVGKAYNPIIGWSSDKGKLVPQIVDMKPAAAAATRVAA